MIRGSTIGITLSKENLSFSKFELERLFDDHEIEFSDNLGLLESSNLTAVKQALDRASYAKEAYEIMAHSDDWDQMIRDVEEADITQFALPDETYKVDSLRIGNTHQATDRGLLAGLTNTTGELQVDVENPDALFVHIKGEKHTYGRKIWENTEPFTRRRNDNLPDSHPTGMDPRMARAMVNIAQPDSCVIDPFCGGGGILLEAGLLGYDTYGIDHDSRMIERAEKNLSSFGIEASLQEGNAIEQDFACQTGVTDVPYGKNSTTSKDASELFASFLDRQDDMSTLVVCYPAKQAFHAVVDAVADEPRSFDFYVNKSLTRRITLLEFS